MDVVGVDVVMEMITHVPSSIVTRRWWASAEASSVDRDSDAVGTISRKFSGVVHVPKLVATLGAKREVVVVEHDERAAVITWGAVFDDVDAHEDNDGSGVQQGCPCGDEPPYTPWSRWKHATTLHIHHHLVRYLHHA